MSKTIAMQSVSDTAQHSSKDHTDEKVQERIRERAYQLYEARGAEPGHELEDWTKAEIEMLGSMNVDRAA
jgi:hypothetical protein